jgi:hypothetical protein
LSENLKVRDHSEDIDTDGRIILRVDLREIGQEDMDSIQVAQDMDQG